MDLGPSTWRTSTCASASRARSAGDLPASVAWLERALGNGQGNAKLRVAIRLELGKTRDLRGERPLAVAQYRQVAEAEDFLGSRREARSLLGHAYHPAP